MHFGNWGSLSLSLAEFIDVTLRDTLVKTTLRDTLLRSTLRHTLVKTTLRNTLRDTLVKTTLRDTLVRATLRDTLVRATVWAMLKFRYHMFNHPFGSHFSFPPLSLPNLPPSAIASAQSKFQMLSKSPQVHSGALSLHSNPSDQVPTSAHKHPQLPQVPNPNSAAFLVP